MAYKFKLYLYILIPVFLLLQAADGASVSSVDHLMGKNDACLLARPDGGVLVAFHEDKKLVPASILKVLTTLTAYHYLGSDFRFHFRIMPDVEP